MYTRTHSMAATTLLLVAAATTGGAQNPVPTPGKMPEHKMDMKGMKEMKDMSAMAGPHHVLAMAYMDNLATFARALQGQVTKSNSVDLDLARPAVAEMRRSFDQMQQYHQGHMMMMMSDSAKAAMSEAMRPMETHLKELGEHLTALESEISAGTPDPKKVAEHTAEILKRCAGMPAMGEPHHVKP